MNNKDYSPLQKQMLGIKEGEDLTEKYKLERDVNQKNIPRDIYEDAERTRFDYAKRDSMNEMLRAASFLKKELGRLNVPVTAFRYENMDVEKWADGRNVVDNAKAHFSIDVLDQMGAQRTFTASVVFSNGEMKKPEFFVDSVGSSMLSLVMGLKIILREKLKVLLPKMNQKILSGNSRAKEWVQKKHLWRMH